MTKLTIDDLAYTIGMIGLLSLTLSMAALGIAVAYRIYKG